MQQPTLYTACIQLALYIRVTNQDVWIQNVSHIMGAMNIKNIMELCVLFTGWFHRSLYSVLSEDWEFAVEQRGLHSWWTATVAMET